MHVLFCLPSVTDHLDRFDDEHDALEYMGVRTHSISIDAVVDGAWDIVARQLEEADTYTELLYRGYMLTEDEYSALAEELEGFGYALTTSPTEYAEANYLPNTLPALEGLTAPSAVVWGTNLDEAWEAAQSLGPIPRMVKDHVKSAKEQWERATYIPPDCDREQLESICEALMEFRGDRFERGFVFRALQPLRRLPFSTPARPIFEEYRLWFWEGALLACHPYYDADGLDAPPTPAELRDLDGLVDSSFYTLDVARLESGALTVLEVGDGGVSGIPEGADVFAFYEALLD